MSWPVVLRNGWDLKDGEAIEPPIVEFYYKNDALGDPLITDEHVRLLKLATPGMVREVKDLATKVNALLLPFFRERRMKLVDFKLEFGIRHNSLILADEISPDTCRFWDMGTGESMDKDRFRKDLGKIEEAYQEVLKRVCGWRMTELSLLRHERSAAPPHDVSAAQLVSLLASPNETSNSARRPLTQTELDRRCSHPEHSCKSQSIPGHPVAYSPELFWGREEGP